MKLFIALGTALVVGFITTVVWANQDGSVQGHADVRGVPKEGPVGTIGEGDLQLVITNRNVCAPGGSFTYRNFIRNTGDDGIQILELTNQFGGALYTHSDPPGEDQIGAVRWSGGPFLAPNAFVEYNATATGGGLVTNTATLKYEIIDAITGVRRPAQVTVTHTIGEACPKPPALPLSLPNNLATIICDISEIGCQQFFPELGRRFKAAQNNPSLQSIVCAQQEYRGSADCVNNKPNLGTRFNHPNQPPTPTILPGECRVLEDAGPSPNDPSQGAPVETTWCESDGYPEFVLPESIHTQKAGVAAITLPDTSTLDGELANIQDNLVRGVACGGRPGDPFWAPSCVCNCNDLTCLPLIQTQGILDVHVVTIEECLADIGRHNQPFL